MRASGLVLLTIGCLALAAGCSGEKKQPAEDTKRAEAPKPKPEPPPAPPKPVAAVAKVEQSEVALPEKTEKPAVADGGAAGEGATGEPAKPGEIELVETEGIGLLELVIARGVEQRKPVGAGQEFSLADGPKLYAVMVVGNPEKVESEVSVSWQQGESGKERGGVTVKVGAQPRWRTWAYHSHFKQPGLYYAIVRDAEGRVLGRAPFALTD